MAYILGFIILVFLLGLMGLQVFLSMSDHKWLGLILPLMSFMFSILSVCYLYQVATKKVDTASTLDTILLELGLVFIIINIFTVIFILIYFIGHRRKKVD